MDGSYSFWEKYGKVSLTPFHILFNEWMRIDYYSIYLLFKINGTIMVLLFPKLLNYSILKLPRLNFIIQFDQQFSAY